MLYDLCIVGAGMYGSAAARHASANPTVKVILIGPNEPKDNEFENREIFGSHYDEGRITRILDEQLCHQQIAKASIKRYRELEKLSGIQFYNPIGFLCVAKRNSACMEEFKRVVTLGKAPVLKLDSETEMKTRFPFLHIQADESALYENTGAGHISPRRLVEAQKKVARMQGCAILSEVVEEISDIEANESGLFHKVITESKRVIQAKRILICTGAFTNFKKLIPNTSSVPAISVNEETAVLLQIPENEAERLTSMPSMCYYKSDSLIENMIGAYILPPIKYPNNNYYLKIGHMNMPGGSFTDLREINKWYRGKGDPSLIKDLPQLMKQLIPGLQVLDTKSITCVSTSNPTHLPYLERISPTVTVAVVGNGCGAKFSDEIGRLAAKLSIYAEWDSSIPNSLFNIVWTKKSTSDSISHNSA